MLTYDPRTISSGVYRHLNALKQVTPNVTHQKEQKSQAVELYTYIATWGLLRLKAEELALSNQPNKRDVVIRFFMVLGELLFPENPNTFLGNAGLERLSNTNQTNASDYLGLTGLALQVGREFAFWSEAIYPKDVPTVNSNGSTGSNEQ